jgi:hypothetical protein
VNLLDDIAAYILAQLPGVYTVGQNFFKSGLEPEPDQQVAIYQSPVQEAPVETLGAIGPVIPRVQIRTRAGARDYKTAENEAWALWNVVSRLRDTVLGGTRYLRAEPLDSPTFLTYDTNERPNFVMNFRVFHDV